MPKTLKTSVRLSEESVMHMQVLMGKTRLSQSALISFALEYLYREATGGFEQSQRFYTALELPAKD